MNQLKISEKIGISPAALTLLKNGRNKTASQGTRLGLEKHFNVNLLWLDSGEGEPFRDDAEYFEPGQAAVCCACNYGEYVSDPPGPLACPVCESELMIDCPRCGEGLVIPSQRYCTRCGKGLKT